MLFNRKLGLTNIPEARILKSYEFEFLSLTALPSQHDHQ